MSLVDSTPVDSTNQDISHSDTFLGRVLNFTNQGLSGGGLAPGASRVIREEDEESGTLMKREGWALQHMKMTVMPLKCNH